MKKYYGFSQGKLSFFFTVSAYIIFLLLLAKSLAAETLEKDTEKNLFAWNLLWTGSWYKNFNTTNENTTLSEDLFSGGTLYNRGDFSLGLLKPDLSLRFIATDKRLLPPEEDDGKAGFNPGAGIYHLGTGSRLLYGVQSDYGLPARINNIWLRAAPFMESRSPSSKDFKTEPAAKDSSETYLYLALPNKLLPGFSAFASSSLDEELNYSVGTGLGYGWSGKEMLFEGFYAQKELPSKSVSSWFSSPPPLPERKFRIFALTGLFSSRLISFAGDFAYSETFSFGSGMYGNFALSIGNKPWRFSLAGDSAGSRFSGRDGSTPGAGFRLAAKGERFWIRSGLLRFQGSIRSPGIKEDFNRGNLSIYFRPSAPSAAEKREKPNPIRFARASLGINRDARNPLKTSDSLDGLAGFNLGPLNAVLSLGLNHLSRLNEESNSPPLFTSPFFETFDSFKISGELGIKFSIFELRTRLGYTTRAKKDPLWEPAINFTARPGKWGRISLKIASTDFPEKINYTFSWTFKL